MNKEQADIIMDVFNADADKDAAIPAARQKVTDPSLLAQLNAPEKEKVSDPALLSQLNEDKTTGVDLPEVPVSKGRTALEQGLQGATYGFSDEATDVIGAYIAHQYTGEPFDKMLKEAREESQSRLSQEEKQHPGISFGAQTAGALINPASLKGAGTLNKAIPGRTLGNLVVKGVAGGAAGGAAYGAGTAGDSLEERAKGAVRGLGTGAITGGVVPAVTSTAAKAVAPVFDKSVKVLQDAGVKLTPGQLSKNSAEFIKRAEGSLKSLPLAGSSMRNAMKESVHSFNTAVLNKALAPLGKKMPKGVEPGRAAIEKAEDMIGEEYDKLIPKLNFNVDQRFIEDIKLFDANELKRLPEAQQKHFESTINSIVGPRLFEDRMMTGQDFKKIDSELAYEARTYYRSPDPGQRELAKAFNKVRGYFRDNLERVNPKYEEKLKNINSSWAMFARAQDASVRRPKSGGVFSANDLVSSIKAASPKGVFARGDGLLQDLAEAGNEVLPDTVPDSGTPERALWSALLTGAIPFEPTAAMAGAAATAPYTKAGMAVTNAWAKNPGAARQAVRKGIEDVSPLLSTGSPLPIIDMENKNDR